MTPSDALDMAAEVVAAFVANNSLPTGELPALIQAVHGALTGLQDRTETSAPQEQARVPAVSIRSSITPAYLICLEDGKHFKSLKRHLAGLGLTPEQYRAKWKLPPDYPMVAPNYALARSELAKKFWLGARTSKREAAPKSPDFTAPRERTQK